MSSLRKRNAKGAKSDKTDVLEELDSVIEKSKIQEASIQKENKVTYTYLIVLTLFAFLTRFYKIDYPNEVVFDEVHFGKFASYYLQRTYFFDLHPPFAKLLIAAVGYLIGYDGSFKFDNIGDSYITNKVPYLAYRSLSAIQGTLTVPILFLTLKELNYADITAALAAAIVLFDNAHIAETRLILLDATLILSVASSIYAYVKFQKQTAYSKKWWTWLGLTGVALSCVISTKYVGVFTFITVGFAVAIDLWNLLDLDSGLTMRQFIRHFAARFYGLIVLPFIIYLYWFYVHFAVLTRSGPGDGFMSGEFQETLGDSPLAKESKQVNYYDTILLKHKQTEALLHSHNVSYPLRYEDGRVSSKGQQVTGFTAGEDINNLWKILPAKPFPKGQELHHAVRLNDIVRFYHVNTQTYLLAHDVASPLFPTNEEFTTVNEEIAERRFNETLFKLPPANGKGKNSIIKTKGSLIKVLHTDTTVALWTHDDVTLPEWGYYQLEVNGNKKLQDSTTAWYFDEIYNLTDSRKYYVPKPVKTMPFFKKWWELQFQMFHQNNKLTSDHPFASDPISWPLSLSGVSFWTNNETKEQIYFIGNLFGWWLEVLLLSSFTVFFIVVKLAEQRKIYILNDAQKKQLFNIGFLFIGYLSHYVFFFLMTRQKFLHHYLPAHLVAGLLSAAILEFLLGRGKALNVTIGVLIFGLAATFYFYAPITYGNVGLTVPEVQAREFFGIKLHFSK